MRKLLIIIGMILLVALVAAGSFWGGMTYQSKQADRIRQNFMTARGMSGDAQMPFGEAPGSGQIPGGAAGLGGNGTNGQVKSINGNVITLSTAQDVATVNILEDTQIKMTVSGDTSDLKTGMRVMVIGEKDSNGNIAANQITVLGDDLPAIPIDQQPPDQPDAGTEP
jgi:hypothetical protein